MNYPSRSEPVNAGQPSPVQAGKHRILFIDDNEDICFIVSALLRASDYEVTTANNMSDGIQLAETQNFDAFILDNLFPDGTGIDLCRELCRIAPSVPVLFLSAAVLESDRLAGFEAGAQAYLTKPDGIFNLADTATNILSRQTKADC